MVSFPRGQYLCPLFQLTLCQGPLCLHVSHKQLMSSGLKSCEHSFTLSLILMVQTGHNFAHVTTAKLLWHVQNCYLISPLFVMSKNLLYARFELRANKPFIKWDAAGLRYCFYPSYQLLQYSPSNILMVMFGFVWILRTICGRFMRLIYPYSSCYFTSTGVFIN